MALADMYKVNNTSYYEGGNTFSGIFTDTISNLLDDNGELDYSIFLNCGADWTYLNTGCKGNHYAMYPDWVGGVLAIRQGPDEHDIKYVGAAIIDKTCTDHVINITKKAGDRNAFLSARFMIDVLPIQQGSASTYVPFNYPAYAGIKFGFNSCIILSTSSYRATNTATSGTTINDYTSLTGDNAKRLTVSANTVYATNYNPYMADTDAVARYSIGYMFLFFEIDGELIGIRNIADMPMTGHWQSWYRYADGGQDVYVTIGTYDSSITAGSQGALPSSDDVKGLYCYNNSGTSQSCFSTKNAISYIVNCYGIRWVIGNSSMTAKDWRDNIRLGVMSANGIIDHDAWIVGEAAINASDNPNKSTDYDHIPSHNPTPGPGPYDDDPWSGAAFSGVSVGGIGAFARCYYMTSTELQNLRSWMGSINVPEGFDPMAQIIGLSQVPVALSGDAAENICFVNSSAVYDPGVTTRVVDSGVASQYAMGLPKKFSLGSVDIVRRMQERGEPYLDYSSQIELYLPLIGMFSLDTQTVMGRTIEAEAVLDPVSGTLAAYAWVSKDGQKLPIAYGSTTIGVDLPVTAQQYSVSKAALKQANAQLATSLLSSALTMVASATASGKAAAYSNGRATAASGMRNAREGFNSFTNAASIAASQTMVSQTGSVFGSFMDWGRSIRQLSYGNNTAISGSFGGSTAQWSYPFTAYVKIIRPRYEKPSNYAHTQGVPCVQAKTVGSCTGFIQCVGVDVSGITRATDIERQAIQAALSNGVYAGGGE